MCRLRKKKRAIILGSLFLLDQVSKYHALKYGFGFINEGVFLGFLLHCFIVPLLIIFLLLSIIYYYKFQGGIFLTLIIVGGISNLIDRFVYGGVIDFISLWRLPIFNLADVMIVVGTAWFAVDFFFAKKI